MSYAGDFPLGATVPIKFTTRRFTTGVPFTLAGSPAVVAYPDASTTELTAGVTLTADFDSRTGLNHIAVVATSGNGYASGSSYFLVLSAGTVDSVSVVGEVVGSFSLERSASFARLGAPAGASIAADIATKATPAQVNAEVLDVLETDTYGEPPQGAPPATLSLGLRWRYLFKWTRNKKNNDGSVTNFYADDGTTVDHKQTTSVAAGTVTKDEIVSGP